MNLLLIIAGLLFLTIGGEILVRGASRLATSIGVTPLIIGLTFVAFGTSAPELAVGIDAQMSGQGSIVLGNIIGSCIFNVLVILGISSLVKPLSVDRRLIRWEIPIMIVSSGLVWLLALNGVLSRLEGLILALGFVGYMVFLYFNCRSGREAECEIDPRISPRDKSLKAKAISGGFILGGLVFLIVGAGWLVDGAAGFARDIHVSELIISMTIVAVGTSIPELVISIIATIRGERDIAVGNVVGSNISNVLVVLGITCMVGKSGIAVEPDVLSYGFPVVTAVAAICLPIFFAHGAIIRLEGALLLINFVVYISYVILRAVEHPGLDYILLGIYWGVLPMTLLFIVVSLVNAFRYK